MNKIYLDQASTSFPKAPSVAQAVYDYLSGSAVNVNRGGYRAAYSVEEQIFETREQLLSSFTLLPERVRMLFLQKISLPV